MMMNALFKEEIDQGHIVIYMDDILIFANDLESHRYWVQQVLKKLQENNLYLKYSENTYELDFCKPRP